MYIKRELGFVDFAEMMREDLYEVGDNLKDYEAGKWVLLSEEQRAFKVLHEDASVVEVWNMELAAPDASKALSDAKKHKLEEIAAYDKSAAVNSFTIGGKEMWLTFDERSRLLASVQAYETMGQEQMTKWFDGLQFTFPLTTWKQMLAALEVYAGDALNVTEQHKANVKALDSIEAVEDYDYTTGYPEKLNF